MTTTYPFNITLTLQGPHLGPPRAQKGPHFALNWPFWALICLVPPRWLVLGRKWIKLIGHMGCDLWDTYMALIWYPRGPSFGALRLPKAHIWL